MAFTPRLRIFDLREMVSTVTLIVFLIFLWAPGIL